MRTVDLPYTGIQVPYTYGGFTARNIGGTYKIEAYLQGFTDNIDETIALFNEANDLRVKRIDIDTKINQIKEESAQLNMNYKEHTKYPTLRQDKAALSEQIGEKAGEAVVRSIINHEGNTCTKLAHTWSDNKVGVFDGIFLDNETGKVYFLEAKGGKSPLGSREIKYVTDYVGRRAQQGTKQYMDDIIENMRKYAIDNEDIELLNTVAIIDAAKAEQNIDYLMVKQDFNTDGSFKDVIIEKFDIQWGQNQ